MCRFMLLILFVFLAGGCNLDQGDEPIIVTATWSGPPPTMTPQPTFTAPPAEVVIEPSPTPSEPTITETVQPTSTPQVTITPLPTRGPTRTPAGPPTVLPLDDGSGRPLADTGNEMSAFSPVEGVQALPEALYYLSDMDGSIQVWRLRYGLTYSDQLTFHPVGVTAFDVAPNGEVAYITVDGEMVVNGIPFLPPDGSGPLSKFTALAWSPSGDWLAYTVGTPDTDFFEDQHPGDGLWIRNAAGNAVLIAPAEYGEGKHVYHGPIDWRPDGTEVLVVYESPRRENEYTRINITDGTEIRVSVDGILPLDSYATARWSVNGNAIIASGAGQVLRIEPDTLGIEVLGDVRATQAQQFGNGMVTFLNETNQIVMASPGQENLTAVTDPLTEQGRVDFLWDNFGEQTLIVVYDPAGAVLGTPYLRDGSNVLHDLTPLTGPIGAPRWGAMFRAGDSARVQTLQGESLNLRDQPGGEVVTQLGNGWRLTILDGPREADGSRWWHVQTTDGITGWAIESVTGSTGLRQWTLVPVG